MAIILTQVANEIYERTPPKTQAQLPPQVVFLLVRQMLIEHGFDIDGVKLVIACTLDPEEVPEPEPQPGGLELVDQDELEPAADPAQPPEG